MLRDKFKFADTFKLKNTFTRRHDFKKEIPHSNAAQKADFSTGRKAGDRKWILRLFMAAAGSLLVLTVLVIVVTAGTGAGFAKLFGRPDGQAGERAGISAESSEVRSSVTGETSGPDASETTGSSKNTGSETADPGSTGSGQASGISAHISFRDNGIYNFGDYQAIMSALKKNLENYTLNSSAVYDTSGGTGFSAIAGEAVPQTGNNSTQAADAGKTQGTSDYSQTNIQVEGVDEADIIKNDGEFIYYIANSSLYVLDVRDPQNMKIAAVIADDFALTDNYVNYLDLFYDSSSKTLSVISSSFPCYYTDVIYPAEDVSGISSGISNDVSTGVSTGIAAAPYNDIYPDQEYTKLQTYDVSDACSPKEIRRFYQDGYYLSSRRINDTVYLVTTKSLWYDSTLSPEELMPSTSDGNDNWNTIPAQDIFVVNPDCADSFTIVSAVDTCSISTAAKTQAVIGQGAVVYSSADSLYITASIWDEKNCQTSSDDPYKTKILSFSITGGTLTAKAAGTVSGTLLNQYSMDEYQGNLRIAATSGGWSSETSNNVYVLDENLDPVSSLLGLAPGESIYSARFAGDRIYLVTYQQVDPFFVIDASDPANLTVMGKLKIPGYSNYLQMLGENLVLAVGNTTYTNGGSVIPAGLKIAVFDVTDPANPVLKSSLIYGDSYGSSEVQYNPKALLLNQAHGLIGLPVCFDLPSGSFGTEYINGYLLLRCDEKGNLTHDYLFKDMDTFLSYGVCRGITVNDTVFLIGYNEVLAYTLDTHEKLDSLSLYE